MTVSLRNTAVIATQLGTSATISVASTTWSTTPVAGDFLVAVFILEGNGAASLGTTPTGWALSAINVSSTDTRAAVYTRTATGTASDNAPTFAGSITSGTAARCAGSVVMYCFYDSSGSTPQLFTYGTATGTSGTLAPVTTATVLAGSYAVAGLSGYYTSTGAMTWTTPASWTSRGVSSGTVYYRYANWSRSAPPAGSTLTCSMAHSSGVTTYEAGFVAVISPPIAAVKATGAGSARNAAPAVDSSALEVSGYTWPGVGSGDTINNITVTINQFASSATLPAPTFELWDNSGTPAKIGATQTGTATTSAANVDTAVFTGVTYSMLAALSVRITAHKGTAVSGTIQNVNWVGLTANTTPAVGGAALPELIMATRIAP